MEIMMMKAFLSVDAMENHVDFWTCGSFLLSGGLMEKKGFNKNLRIGDAVDALEIPSLNLEWIEDWVVKKHEWSCVKVTPLRTKTCYTYCKDELSILPVQSQLVMVKFTGFLDKIQCCCVNHVEGSSGNNSSCQCWWHAHETLISDY